MALALPELTAEERNALAGPGAVGRAVQPFRSPAGVVTGILLVALLILAAIAPVLWQDEATRFDTDALSQDPSTSHWAGTDSLGRDVFYRVLVATRMSVGLALAASALGVAVGVILGSLPWLMGRRWGRFATGGVNLAVAFPSLLLAIFFAVVFGVGAKGAVLAIGLAMAPWFGRMTQTLVSSIETRDFIAASLVSGARRWTVLYRHILPNIAAPLIVNATLAAGGALLAFAGLSFLGLGVQLPSYDWGVLLNEGLDGIYVRPWAALVPAVAIVAAGLIFNLFGEVLATDPSHRGSPKLAPAGHTEAPQSSTSSPAGPSVLEVRGLRVSVPRRGRYVEAVRGLSFSVRSGEIVGLVGESGSGKTLTAMAVAGLLEDPVSIQARTLQLAGRPIPTNANSIKKADRDFLGQNLAFVFQDATSALNPVIRIGPQLAEVTRAHGGLGRRGARQRAVERLAAVRITSPARRARQFPHEFSGGMRQRAMIAMAMMNSPKVIIADEPTTALDAQVQRHVLQLLDDCRTSTGAGILLVSHDISMVRTFCDRVLVMYAGRIVEELPARDLIERAEHPYTRALIGAVPDIAGDPSVPLMSISGRAPDPSEIAHGCAFAPRCAHASELCGRSDPDLNEPSASHPVACWHPQVPIGQELPEEVL